MEDVIESEAPAVAELSDADLAQATGGAGQIDWSQTTDGQIDW
jgi:hypothetical protein